MVKVVAAGRAVSPVILERNMRKPVYMQESMVAHILSSVPKIKLFIYNPNIKKFDEMDRKNYRTKCNECDLNHEPAEGKRNIPNDTGIDNQVKEYEDRGWPKYKVDLGEPTVEP